MTQTPFQKALDWLEDQIFRLPAHRRRECIDRTLSHMRRTLPGDYRRTQRYEFKRLAHDSQAYHHHAIVDAVNAFPAMRDRCVVSVAQAHGQRLWWLPFLLLWNSITSGVDVFEYALNWYLVTRRWFPRVALSPVIAATAMICSDVRRMQAAGSRVPSWCLAWQRAPVVAVKVCAWRIGWLSGWQWLCGGATKTGDAPDYSFLPGALRVVLAALSLCAVLWPEHAGAGVSMAALGAAGVVQTQTDGSDTNGGGYQGGGTDYTQQAAAQVSVTDLVTTSGSSTVTSATASFTSAMTGNWVYIQGGTGSITADWYVFTYVSSTSGTLDRSTGIATGTGATLNLGGAMLSPARLAGKAVTGNAIYVKTGTYTLTTASTNVAGGCVSLTNGVRLEGFGSSRGDLSSPPTLQLNAGVTSANIVFSTANQSFTANLVLDCNDQTGSSGVFANTVSYLVTAKKAKSQGFGATVTGLRCTATLCGATGWNSSGAAFGVESYGNTSNAGIGAGLAVSFGLSYGNTGAGADGLRPASGTRAVVSNVVLQGNGRDGWRHDQAVSGVGVNVVSADNGGYGFSGAGSVRYHVWFSNCYTRNNTSGGVNTSDLPGQSATALTADPFTNAAGGDFSLNATAGGGAVLRGSGWPGVYPRGTTTGYLDAGAVQHQDSGGGTVVRFPASLDGGMV